MMCLQGEKRNGIPSFPGMACGNKAPFSLWKSQFTPAGETRLFSAPQKLFNAVVSKAVTDLAQA